MGNVNGTNGAAVQSNGKLSDEWQAEIDRVAKGETAWQKYQRGFSEQRGYNHELHRDNDLEKNQGANSADLDALIDSQADRTAPISRDHVPAREVGQVTLAVEESAPDAEYLPGVEIEQWLPETEIELRPWLMADWLPANEVSLFVGRGGVGKSYLMLQVVGKIAAGWQGLPWEDRASRHGEPFADGQKVFIASWEDDTQEVSDRLHRIQKSLGFLPHKHTKPNIGILNMRKVCNGGPLWGVGAGESLGNRAKLLPAGQAVLDKAAEFGACLCLTLQPRRMVAMRTTAQAYANTSHIWEIGQSKTNARF